MPFIYSWPLISAPIPPPASPTASLLPVFPTTGSVSICNAPRFTYQHFLDLFGRVFPFNYIQPIQLAKDGGYDLFRGNAAVGERVSLAVERFECGSFAIFATGGAYATGTVEFLRPNSAAGAFTLKAGTIVYTSRGGRRFVTTEDVSFGALDVGPIAAPIIAEAAGYEWNVRGEVITESGIALEGEIDSIQMLITDPHYADPTITVRQLVDTTGGTAPMLDGLGDDRGLPRAPTESDDLYRLRIRSLPDTISPDAIRRAVSAYLSAFGLSYQFIETWQIEYQTCWDAPSPNVGTPSYQAVAPINPRYNSNLFVYDDPRPQYPLNNVWLDEAEYRGAFIIVVERATINDFGLAFDDPGVAPSDFRNPATGFGRGTPAFDISAAAPSTIYPSFYDGYDLAVSALFSGLYDILQRIKPVGVAAIVERERV